MTKLRSPVAPATESFNTLYAGIKQLVESARAQVLTQVNHKPLKENLQAKLHKAIAEIKARLTFHRKNIGDE